jgi:multidrug resistance protein, MATE family
MRRDCGVLHNRGRFVVSVVMIPIIVIFAFSDTILVKLHQDAAVASIARTYVCLMIPGVWAMGQFDSTKKFLSSQYKNSIPVWAQVVTTILHFGWCQWFIVSLDMRERGAAAATNITYILNMVISDVIIRYKKDDWFKDMVFFYDSTVLNNLKNYLKIGIPGMLMLCFEWWCFELLAIFTGLLGVGELAAEVVIINLIAFIFMLPLGISYSASALTGNYLGEGKIDLAKKFAQMVVLFDAILTSIIVLVLGVCQDSVTTLFTKDPEVVAIFKKTIWVLLIYIWFDTIHGVQSGIIRGLGRQAYGSVYTLFCYYILGLPFALVLCFKAKMGIAGLWLGMSIACIILDVGFAFIIACPDWHEISRKARIGLD